MGFNTELYKKNSPNRNFITKRSWKTMSISANSLREEEPYAAVINYCFWVIIESFAQGVHDSINPATFFE